MGGVPAFRRGLAAALAERGATVSEVVDGEPVPPGCGVVLVTVRGLDELRLLAPAAGEAAVVAVLSDGSSASHREALCSGAATAVAENESVEEIVEVALAASEGPRADPVRDHPHAGKHARRSDPRVDRGARVAAVARPRSHRRRVGDRVVLFGARALPAAGAALPAPRCGDASRGARARGEGRNPPMTRQVPAQQRSGFSVRRSETPAQYATYARPGSTETGPLDLREGR
jgi:hypothetical protein